MDFIMKNKSFWMSYQEDETDQLLLAETSSNPVINHSNAVVAKMIAKALGLRIAWLKYDVVQPEIMRSYSFNSLFWQFKQFKNRKILFLLQSIYYYLVYVLVVNRLLSFHYKRIPYGDFIYDNYLAYYSMATLHRFDWRLVKIFYIILKHDTQAREVLSRSKIKAVLVSHYMGMNTGPLSRVAMQMGIPVYWKGGGHEIFNLSVFRSLGQIYDFPKKPSPREIDMLLNEYGEQIEEEFRDFIRENSKASYGVFSVGYNSDLSSAVTKKRFLQDMGLEENKPLVFVMMHAFNDHPRSHFKTMLFNDYCDWFIQTYRFALKEPSKNWIFKQHPADKFYPTEDLDLKRVMYNLPPHIRFVPYDSAINAAVVLNVADAIVTCLGTAGVEMPSLRAIPAVIAGESTYNGLGFTIEPKSKKEYFEVLLNLRIEPLTKIQQLRAKCCYLYVDRYCMVPIAAGPAITFDEAFSSLEYLNQIYPQRVLSLYNEKADLIYKQFDEYVQDIRSEGFARLLRLPKKNGRDAVVIDKNLSGCY